MPDPKTAKEEADPTGDRRRSRVRWPWQAEGWYTDELKSERGVAHDAELDAKLAAIGHGWLMRPTFRQSPHGRGPINNPWMNLGLAVLFSSTAAWFALGETPAPPVVDTIGPIVIALFAAFFLVLALPRFAVWHRARRIAREHVAEHGGEFPLALRWYQ